MRNSHKNLPKSPEYHIFKRKITLFNLMNNKRKLIKSKISHFMEHYIFDGAIPGNPGPHH